MGDARSGFPGFLPATFMTTYVPAWIVSVAFEPIEMLLILRLDAPGGPALPMIATLSWPPSVKFPSATGPAARVIVTVPRMTVQDGALSPSEAHEPPETLVVGGSVTGSGGVSTATGAGSWTTVPFSVAEPPSVNASPAMPVPPLWHVPTPVRGVYRFPLIVALPLS